MKRKNHLSRTLAWLLVLAMTVCMLPSVTAVSSEMGDTASQGTDFEEVTALREENVKHFSLGDGAYQAVVYGHPVHYQDENGAWQDIDNRLTLQTVKGVQQYATADSRVAFAPSYRANTQLLGLRNGEYSLSMGLKTQSLSASVMALNETAQISAAVTNPQLEITNIEQAQAADWSSTVVYEGVLPNVDLEYIVEYDYIKENIIVNAPSAAYEYAFTLELNGMYAELLGDGSVGIYCSKTEEEKYTIPAPYMYDANGKLSLDVAYTLTGTAGNYTLTVNADASWINRQDCAFPVTIDPSFIVSTGVPLDTYISANRPTVNFSRFSTLWVSEDEITYIDPVSDITLPIGATLDYAALTVFYFYPDGAEACGVDVGAYQVTSFWGESTATWNSMSALPNFGMSTTCSTWETADSDVGATISAPRQLDFFITDIMENWMEGDAQRGVALKYECGDGLDVGFLSYEAGYDYRPGITYRYHIDSVALTASSTRQLSTGHRYTFTFTPTATDKYSFWTTGSADTTISLYSDDSSSSLIEQKTTGGHSANACLTERLTAGTTYHLAVQGTGSASTPFSFKVYRGLPLSGSEQPARLSEFNSATYKPYTNCYTYALNLLKNPVTNTLFTVSEKQPGGIAGISRDISKCGPDIPQSTMDEFMRVVREDLVAMGGTTDDIRIIQAEDMPNPGYYKVTLLYHNLISQEYHWYRQLPDGRWAHKRGETEATYEDKDDNYIYDPETANHGDYTLIGFFEIKLP